MPDRNLPYRVDHYSTLFKGFLIGSLFGAVVTLLSAPQRGEETTEQLRQKSMELRDRAMEMTEETRLRAKELKERSQMIYADQKSKLESVMAGVQEGTRVLIEPEMGSDIEQAITLETQTTDITSYDSPEDPYVSDLLDEGDETTSSTQI